MSFSFPSIDMADAPADHAATAARIPAGPRRRAENMLLARLPKDLCERHWARCRLRHTLKMRAIAETLTFDENLKCHRPNEGHFSGSDEKKSCGRRKFESWGAYRGWADERRRRENEVFFLRENVLLDIDMA